MTTLSRRTAVVIVSLRGGIRSRRAKRLSDGRFARVSAGSSPGHRSSLRGRRVRVVSGQARRRWSVVAGGVLLLCALPAVHAVLPVSAPRVSLARLQARIL